MIRAFRGLMVVMTVWGAALGASAEPTAVRSWKSTAGTAIEAKATALGEDSVTFETTTGRVLTVPLAKLVPADQALLNQHFKPAVPTATAASGATASPAVLSHPAGKVTDAIDAGGGSHYHLYLPKSLKAGRKAPLLFYTHSGGGSAGAFRPLLEGAEICGWIVAMSVESKNGMDKSDSVVHSKRCVDHLLESQSIDPKRVYFAGVSGGAREAFFNSSKMSSAGVLALIAGAQPDELDRGKHYFFISGANDFNRYGTSKSYSAVKSSGAMRFHPGAHADGPGWLVTEGMIWLEAKWNGKGKVQPGAREDFEAAALTWAERMKSTEPYRAAWWAKYLSETGLLSPAMARAEALTRELGAKPEAIAYAKGLVELEKFAIDALADGPNSSPECFEHTNPDIQKKADKLLAGHAATPWIKEILTSMKKPTDKL